MKINKEHFARCSLLQHMIVAILFLPLVFLCLHPTPNIYLEGLGRLGQWYLLLHKNYLKHVQNALIGTAIIHSFECLYLVKLAMELELYGLAIFKWVVQTLFLGIFSLSKFIAYHKKCTKSQKHN